jgi:hypothetical protein
MEQHLPVAEEEEFGLTVLLVQEDLELLLSVMLVPHNGPVVEA